MRLQHCHVQVRLRLAYYRWSDRLINGGGITRVVFIWDARRIRAVLSIRESFSVIVHMNYVWADECWAGV